MTADAEPIPCSPCRGTGKVMSNLGGSPSELPCPWCEGGGWLIADHDAQATHRAADPQPGVQDQVDEALTKR